MFVRILIQSLAHPPHGRIHQSQTYSKRAAIWGQRISRPTPFRNMPRIITKKYLKGIDIGDQLHHGGHVGDGEHEADNRIAGNRKKKVVMRACCWVRLTVEIRRPRARQESRYISRDANKRVRLPRMGTPNQKTPTEVTRATWIMPTRAKGMVFSQDKFHRPDGGDHDLFHGADFLFPDHGHGGQVQNADHDDQGDDSGNVENYGRTGWHCTRP